MQTSAIAQRITAAAHNLTRLITAGCQSLVLDDQRLRQWTTAENGGMFPLAAPTGLTVTPTNGGALLANTAYFYGVTAYNALNETVASIIVKGLTTNTNLSMALAWNAVSGATGYKVYRTKVKGNFASAGAGLIATQAGTTLTDTGLGVSAAVPPPLSAPYDFDAGVTPGGRLLRLRTLPSNTLDLRWAAPADTLTWSANVITANAKAGFGVALVVYGAQGDVFWIGTDGLTVKTAHCANLDASPPVFGAVSTVLVLPTQVSTALPRLSAPAQNVLFIADAPATPGLGTRLGYTLYSAGAWGALQNWDLNYQAMALNAPVTLPANPNKFGATLDVLPLLDANGNPLPNYLAVSYVSRPRAVYDEGLYAVRVNNAQSGQSAQWSNFLPVFATNSLSNASAANVNTYTLMYCTFPRLQMVSGQWGQEYWVTAVEVSQYAGVVRLNLVYFRSLDGVHWSDRKYLYGYTNTASEQRGIYLHDGGATPFNQRDVLYARFLVSGNRAFVLAYDATYLAAATSQCQPAGATNPARQLDVTASALEYRLSGGAAGEAALLSVTLDNPTGQLNAGTQPLLRRGMRWLQQVGYVTTNGAELVRTLTGIIDEVQQDVEAGKNVLKVTVRDYLKKLQDWTAEVFYEFFSGSQLTVPQFNDVTMFMQLNGAFTSSNGQLLPAAIPAGTAAAPQPRDAMAFLALTGRTQDGFIEIEFQSQAAWGTVNHAGVVLQGVDNRNYWAVLYNNVNYAGQFTLQQAVPAPVGTAFTFKYKVPPAPGAGQVTATTVSLAPRTKYWLRAQLWHNRVQAFYSTDRKSWTKVIDYWGYPLTSDAAYWGIVGVGATPTTYSDGNVVRGTTAAPSIDNGSSRADLAIRIVPDGTGTATSISAIIFRSNTPDLPPDLVAGLCADLNGSPDYTNIKWTGTVPANNIPQMVSSGIQPYAYFTVDTTVNLTAGVPVWFFAHPNSDYTSTATYWWRDSGGVGGDSRCVTKYSYDNGTTWQTLDSLGYPAGDNVTAMLFYQVGIGGTAFLAMNFSSGENPKTLEYIATDIAAKAGVLSLSADAVVGDNFSTSSLGLDGTANNWSTTSLVGSWSVGGGVLTGTPAANQFGLLRNNTTYGVTGDLLLECDVNIPSTTFRAGFLLRAGATLDPTNFTGYAVELNPGGQVLNVYCCQGQAIAAAQKIYTGAVLVPIPIGVTFHVTLVQQSGWLSIYLNEALVGACYDTTLPAAGYFGFYTYSTVVNATPGPTFDNFRVPDLLSIKPYFAMESRQTGKAALDRLIRKDRVKYFARYDGSLRLSSYRTRTAVDTYTADLDLIKTTRVDSDRYWASHLQPEGNYYADRMDGDLLDTDGERFHHEDYTDAFTDLQAYGDAAVPLRTMKELTVQYKLESACVPTLEREDVVTVQNPVDGTSAQFVITDFEFTFKRLQDGNLQNLFAQQLGLRSYVT